MMKMPSTPIKCPGTNCYLHFIYLFDVCVEIEAVSRVAACLKTVLSIRILKGKLQIVIGIKTEWFDLQNFCVR